MAQRLLGGIWLLIGTTLASGCAGPSRTTFHERPADTVAVPLRAPLTLAAELEYVRFVRNGEQLDPPDSVVSAFAKDFDDAGLFKAVRVRGATPPASDGEAMATLRLEIHDTYRRNALANMGKMLLGLATLTASSSALPVTADLEQTMTLELLLPTGGSTTYTARSATTHEMAAASPSEDAMHWERVASTNFTALLQQVRTNPDLRKWEPTSSPAK